MSKVCTQRLLVLNLRNEEHVHMIRHFQFYSSRWTRCLHRWKAFQFKPCGSRLWGQSQDSEDWTLQKGLKIFSIKHLLTSIARELKYVGILTETAFEQCGWTERWVTSMIMIMIMVIMTLMTKHWNHADFLSSPHLDAIFNPPSAWWSAWRSPCTSTTSVTWRWQSQTNPNPKPHTPIQSDIQVIHTIRDTPPNPSGLLSLSTDSSHCYLAYPGTLAIFNSRDYNVTMWQFTMFFSSTISNGLDENYIVCIVCNSL